LRDAERDAAPSAQRKLELSVHAYSNLPEGPPAVLAGCGETTIVAQKTTLADYVRIAARGSVRLLPPRHTRGHTMSAIPPAYTPRYDVIDSLYRHHLGKRHGISA
jgi:hypothetical protein